MKIGHDESRDDDVIIIIFNSSSFGVFQGQWLARIALVGSDLNSWIDYFAIDEEKT